MGAFMIVLCHLGRNPTNKGALAVRIEPGLIRQNERTLPTEPSPHWHIDIIIIYYNDYT